MNKLLLIFVTLLALGKIQGQTSEKDSIQFTLDNWHKAAGEANFANYFDLLTEDAIFIGTDAAEVWSKTAFMAFSKPYFDQGKAWDFKAVERNIYLDPSGKVAWFDELLDTWMQLCRGSGVLIKENGTWKIAQYVLSLTIPNEEIEPVISLKKERDSTFLNALRKQE
jgi:ketosteroid isomerase-like protein